MGFVTTSWGAWVLVLAAGVNSCVGNLLLKQSRRVAEDGGLVSLLVSPWFLAGLAFYGVNVVLFAKALEKLPVSVAYPALAGSGFAMLVVASAWFFQENLSPLQYLGLGVVAVGISLLAWS